MEGKRMELVMGGYLALEGTAAAVKLAESKLSVRLPQELLEAAGELWEEQSRAFRRFAANREPNEEYGSFYYIEEGESLFHGLWQLSLLWKTGFHADLLRLPLRQETVEICECLELNPYGLRSGGCLLAACENGGRLVRILRENGLAAGVIGELTDNRDKLLTHGRTTSCLNRPEPDELERWAAGVTQ